MKRVMLRAMTLTGLMFTLSVALVQAQSGRMITTKIPFDFTVNDKTMSAGTYIIEPVQIAGSEALKIQTSDGHFATIVLSKAVIDNKDQGKPELIFNRFGEHYFLAKVKGFDSDEIFTLPTSRVEDRLAKAEKAMKRETVSVNIQR